MHSPVLFLVFNRPDLTAKVFETIRSARPPKLYVAADGPRTSEPNEANICEVVRRIATDVDWPCDVRRLFQPINLGCKLGVSTGINWFFENEEAGIILEDDVLPLPSFFSYCDILLEKYRFDDRIGLISGSNLISSKIKYQESYFFSQIPLIWGWASWRRTWRTYDVQMKTWPTWDNSGGLKKLFPSNILLQSYWRDAFNRVYFEKLDTWDYQLIYASWKTNALTIIPAENLTDNLGYGLNATHTSNRKPASLEDSVPRNLDLPLRHPDKIKINIKVDYLIFKHVHEIDVKGFIRKQLRPLRKLIKVIKRYLKIT